MDVGEAEVSKTVTQHIRDHLMRKLDPKRVTLSELFNSEWSDEFERYMRNRLVFGAFRYGRLGDSNKLQWDRIGAARERLAEYEKTGNLEFLVDIANFMLLEFVEGKHPNRHFESTEDTEKVRSKGIDD